MPRAREKRRVSSRTHFPCSENHRARSAAPSRRCRPQRHACRGLSPIFTSLARPTTHPLHFHDPGHLTLTPAQVQLRGRADAAEKPDLPRVELRSTPTIPPHRSHTQHRARRAWLMIFDAHISPCGPHVPSPCLAERPHRPPPTTTAACTELDPEGRPSLHHRGPSIEQPRILARGPSTSTQVLPAVNLKNRPRATETQKPPQLRQPAPTRNSLRKSAIASGNSRQSTS